MTPILQLIDTLEKAREKATHPFPWDDEPASQEWLDNRENNIAFVRAAANGVGELTEFAREAVDVIRYYASEYPPISGRAEEFLKKHGVKG